MRSLSATVLKLNFKKTFILTTKIITNTYILITFILRLALALALVLALQ